MSNLFGTTDILAKALEGSWARNQAIANNIANADTPGYKRKDVAFEQYLSVAVEQSKRGSQVDVNQLQPRTYVDRASMSYRLDGNNVDVDTEMGYLAENQLRYNALINQVNYNFERIKSVLRD